MITTGGLCHIICSRNWHNLAPHTLMYRSRLCLPACEPRVDPKVQGGRHWQHCFPFAKTEVQYYKDGTEQITLQQISPALSILHVLSPIYKEITRNVQEREIVVGEVPQTTLLKKWSFFTIVELWLSQCDWLSSSLELRAGNWECGVPSVSFRTVISCVKSIRRFQGISWSVGLIRGSQGKNGIRI
jgi:hypothetical protein